jgi:putative ABC transport system permease protein
MIRPRWKKVLADLFSHKIRSLLVIASIAVGLFAVGMTTTTYAILSADIRSGYLAVHAANIQIVSSLFDEDFVERIRRAPGISEAQGATNKILRVHVAESKWKPISIKAMASDDMEEQSINKVELLQGVWPPEDKQIVLDVNKMAQTGASLGDELEIKLPSGVVRRMQVVGVVRDQTIGSAGGEGGFFISPIQGYVTADTLPWLEQPDGFNTLYAAVIQGQEDRAAIRLVADAILDEFEQNGYRTSSSVVRRSTDHPNLPYVDAMVAVI